MSMHIFPTRPQQTRTALSLRWALAATVLTSVSQVSWAAPAQPVPGYVAPVMETPVAPYVDDTRGVYVPAHEILRQKTNAELSGWSEMEQSNRPFYAQTNPNGKGYQRALNTLANGVPDTGSELDRISQDPGLLAGGVPQRDARLYAQDRYADNTSSQAFEGTQMAQNTARTPMPNASYADISPAAGPQRQPNLKDYPSLATGGAARTSLSGPDIGAAGAPNANGVGEGGSNDGVELAVSGNAADNVTTGGTLDLQNSIVRLKEERISVRRALQRMLDQVGGGGWTVVWDLDEANAGLPDMEISIYAEEPFIKVLNALLARLQTRSGQPIRVIKYDNTKRIVITDRTGGDARSASAGVGSNTGADMAVTETVLKQSAVSLHYDEIPLVDALENIVNQAGKGQWRLRMYAGTDQVLKPAHIEEPFGVAVDRILKIFNLRYEIFPGGKLIVVTSGSSFGFRGVE